MSQEYVVMLSALCGCACAYSRLVSMILTNQPFRERKGKMDIPKEMAEAIEEEFVESIPDSFINCARRRPSVRPSVKRGKSALSFREAIEEAEAQIVPESFERSLRERVREVCRVIAEIYMLPDGARVKIEGEELPVEAVREVFAQLNDQHVRYSLERFDGYEGRIFAMKPFLRTLLYNSVFEMESH